MDGDRVKFTLDEDSIPQEWYNVVADAPFVAQPVLHPVTKNPIGVEDLAPILPMALIAQEVSRDRWIPIPKPVRDAHRVYRPTPLYRARRLEKYLDTPAHVYYKHEGVSPIGSHKPNSQLAQAFYTKERAEGGRVVEWDQG
jgi:tryptophan synthase beta chain